MKKIISPSERETLTKFSTAYLPGIHDLDEALFKDISLDTLLGYLSVVEDESDIELLVEVATRILRFDDTEKAVLSNPQINELLIKGASSKNDDVKELIGSKLPRCVELLDVIPTLNKEVVLKTAKLLSQDYSTFAAMGPVEALFQMILKKTFPIEEIADIIPRKQASTSQELRLLELSVRIALISEDTFNFWSSAGYLDSFGLLEMDDDLLMNLNKLQLFAMLCETSFGAKWVLQQQNLIQVMLDSLKRDEDDTPAWELEAEACEIFISCVKRLSLPAELHYIPDKVIKAYCKSAQTIFETVTPSIWLECREVIWLNVWKDALACNSCMFDPARDYLTIDAVSNFLHHAIKTLKNNDFEESFKSCVSQALHDMFFIYPDKGFWKYDTELKIQNIYENEILEYAVVSLAKQQTAYQVRARFFDLLAAMFLKLEKSCTKVCQISPDFITCLANVDIDPTTDTRLSKHAAAKALFNKMKLGGLMAECGAEKALALRNFVNNGPFPKTTAAVDVENKAA